MRIIDFHTHIYPDEIARKASDSVRSFYGFGEHAMDGTVATLLRQGKLAGITDFVILPVALRADRVRHINEFVLSQTGKHPEFFGFGTIHAAMEDLEEEVQFILDSGLRGVKMHPDTQRFHLDDPRLFPAYERMQGNCPVIFHMGDPRLDNSHPFRLRRVLEQFPKLQVIAAHFGGYQMYAAAIEELEDKNCFFDVSSSLMFMQPGEAERFINRCGAERFVYGSDYPMWDPVKEVQAFFKLKLSSAQLEQIAHKTAEEILHV